MRVTTTVGADKTATTKAEEGEHSGRLTLRLNEGSDARVEHDLIQRLRALLRDLPETDIEVSHPALFSFKTPIELEIRGHDLHLLRRLSQQAVEMLSTLPGIVDVKSSLKSGNPELQINYNRERLAGYGLNMRTVAELVRNKVQGKVATEFREEERQVRILVRLQEKDRLGIEELNRLVVNPNGEVPIPLGAIAEINVSEGPSEIRRIDQQRTALITANIRDIDLGTASQNIVTALRQGMDFPLGFSYLISGQKREMETSLSSLFVALALAIFLVYIVMASQFESLIHPFVIMFTVPLALVGVVAVALLRRNCLEYCRVSGTHNARRNCREQRHRPGGLHQHLETSRPGAYGGDRSSGHSPPAPHIHDHPDYHIGIAADGSRVGRRSGDSHADGAHRNRRPYQLYLSHPDRDPYRLFLGRSPTIVAPARGAGLLPAMPESRKYLLPRISVERPVSVVMLLVAALVVGYIAYSRIPLNLVPDGIESDRLFIWVSLGVSI